MPPGDLSPGSTGTATGPSDGASGGATEIDTAAEPLRFIGGSAGALAPIGVFLAGVAWLGLSGAPDERGFWPILLAALATGVLLSRDRTRYSEAAIAGMSRPIVLTMVMAWVLAGVLGSLVAASGFVQSLAELASVAGLEGGSFAVAAFAITAVVATATGTSLGTLILCAPLLFPPGVALAVDPAVLIGAILGGATFGDNISPVSDTTIASASTQGADIGGVVRSRLKYALPAAALAAVLYGVLGGGDGGLGAAGATAAPTSRLPLLLVLGPAVVIALLLRRRHLLESLLAGIGVTMAVGLAIGSIAPPDLLSIDREAFLARGLVLDGMQRAVGISVFTILLMGVVAGVEASGAVDRLITRIAARTTTPRRAEWSIFAAVSAAVLLTTHSVVALLAAGPLANETGTRAGISGYRRANLMDLTVCTYPFLLPFFIPTILAASQTGGAADLPLPRVSPFEAGLYNAHSWALLAVLLVAIATGWGRGRPTESARAME